MRTSADPRDLEECVPFLLLLTTSKLTFSPPDQFSFIDTRLFFRPMAWLYVSFLFHSPPLHYADVPPLQLAERFVFFISSALLFPPF